MFLQYGVNEHGELVSIEQVPRGRLLSIVCPYCGAPLLAKKGSLKTHHFAHTGETCREVERSADTVSLPAYDRFNLHVPARDVASLRAFAENDWQNKRSSDARLVSLDLIRYNEWLRHGGDYELTKKGKLVLGQLSLMLFNDFQEPLLLAKHEELEQAVTWAKGTVDFATRLTDLKIYRAQLRRILSLTLYFLKITTPDGDLYKIGVTNRDVEARVAEVRRDLNPLFSTPKIEVLGTWAHRGNAELYFKYRYKAYQKKVGQLTEYFAFDEPKKVLLDLRRMKPKELTELETQILAGLSSSPERDLLREDRRAAIRAGMQRAAAQGQRVGRPSGQEDNETFLSKPKAQAVIAALQAGMSLRQASKHTGAAIGTVQKVKRLLG